MRILIYSVVCFFISISSANAEIPVLDDKKKFKVNGSTTLPHTAPFNKIVFSHNVSIGNVQSQIACLAANIYFEARSEDIHGRLSVAHVTMNRVNSNRYPDDVCEVVAQPWQFSWYNGEDVNEINEKQAWGEALYLARLAYTNNFADPTSGALYYHRVDVSPQWSNRVAYIATIGEHRFYN